MVNSANGGTANDEAGNERESIKVLARRVRLPPPSVLGGEFREWKRRYWSERMSDISCVVAPMVDQSELAFRMMLRKHGAQLAYTPMIHASLFVSDHTYRRKAFSTCEGDRPLIVQFCTAIFNPQLNIGVMFSANDPSTLISACRLVEGHCDGVDLNLGCPQLIAKRGRYGAYLQESQELIAAMIEGVFESCRLPISVKIRVLVSPEHTLDYARMIERSGASMLTVHGRTREQKGAATGLANWEMIRAVKGALTIPVIANGNIQGRKDVDNCLAMTGADAVMSAEGILNNPMLFEGMHHPVHHVAREYLQYAETYKAGLSAIRAHLFRIFHHSLLKHDDLRDKTSYVGTISQFEEIVDEVEKRILAKICATDEPGGIEAKLQEVYNLLPSETSTEELVKLLPDWVCKPYIRPASGSPEESEQSSIKASYREERRVHLEQLSLEMNLSKKQLRKRERRRLEQQRKVHSKPEYPRCPGCNQPRSQNCQNLSCRKCCRKLCIQGSSTCTAHQFTKETLLSKRSMYAKRLEASLKKELLAAKRMPEDANELLSLSLFPAT